MGWRVGRVWGTIKEYFDEYPARRWVARFLLRHGLKVTGDASIRCGVIKVPYTRIARALNVERRAVKETAVMILGIPELREVFTRLEPVGVLKRAGSVVEIETGVNVVGVLARVAEKFEERGINVIQVVVDNLGLDPGGRITIVAGEPIPGDLVNELSRLKGVKKVTIY